ncbi:MAG: tyrosine-type recombinase/integrase, partial [Kiritimatiellaeota bacterium]|nr:tyrosine-type recombinase/integrase [Kiritimatiellota bacterium]
NPHNAPDPPMIQYVFQRPRGTGKKSKYWTGRYSLAPGERYTEVALGLTDYAAAKAELQRLVIEAQREHAGLIPKKSYRDAAATPLETLLTEYIADIRARRKTEQYARVSQFRIRAIITAAKWTRLNQITPQTFTRWRANHTGAMAAKTLREYQTMLSAFLNWLAAGERIERNPLAKVKLPETRGMAVRPSRAYTLDDLQKIFAAAETPAQRLAFQLLAYTGQRCKEIAELAWADVHLDSPPHILIREHTTKDKKQRAIPLHPQLVQALTAHKPPAGNQPMGRVIPDFPRWREFVRVLDKAGIPKKDERGRVAHLHCFRKTFQTLAATHGVHPRASQEFLGHTDANLTAKIYTDLPAHAYRAEVAKLPWPGGEVSSAAVINPPETRPVAKALAELITLLQTPEAQEEISTLTPSQVTAKMERAKRLEHGEPPPLHFTAEILVSAVRRWVKRSGHKTPPAPAPAP